MEARQRTGWSLAFVQLLLGCATAVPQDTLALTGTITELREISRTQGSAGVYRPGQGGALGGLVAGMITGATTTPRFFVYTMRMSDGQSKDVNSPEEHQIGECLDVLVEKSKASLGYIWKPEEVTLRASKACT